MAKKKQYDDALKIDDLVMKNVISSLVLKMHLSLCNVQQTTGYVPYHKCQSSALIWTDLRRRGRSTFGDHPTISFIKDAREIHIWWNRHFGDKLDILGVVITRQPTISPDVAYSAITLDDLHAIEEAFGEEIHNCTTTLNTLLCKQQKIMMEIGVTNEQ